MDKHKLDYVARGVGLGNFRHHSASDDARVLAGIFINFLNRLEKELGIEKISEINQKAGDLRRERYNKTRGLPPVRHIILIARNAVGLKNLYKLVSLGHIKYMDSRKRQIMPRHEIEKHREGLLIGSACEAGELYRAVLEGKSHRELREIARFYDFLEIQPAGNNEFDTRGHAAHHRGNTKHQPKDSRWEKSGIPVVATGDVHFLDPEDEVYRRIIMAGKGFEDADMQAPLF